MAAIAFLTVMAVISHAYLQYLNPLARLKGSIRVGDSYASLEPQIREFRHRHPASTLTSDRTVHHLLKGPVPAAQQLFLYQATVLGEVYLQVLFDDGLKVSEVSYLVD